MASRALLFAALCATTFSVILSIPQQNLLVQPHEPVVESKPGEEVITSDMVPNNLPNIDPRSFGSLFNLSAYLANAPTNSAALNFIPLITILSAALGG